MKVGVDALLFDFDGLLIDTETPLLRLWIEAYDRQGQRLPLDLWADSIGTHGGLDPLRYLEQITDSSLSDLGEQLTERARAIVHEQPLRPGVRDRVDEAVSLGLKIAIVSSSSTEWVMSHLTRVDLTRWDGIFCADGDSQLAKPAPALYRRALRVLDVSAESAVAFEDSRNGVAAAKEAGLYCFAVPNEATSTMNLSDADMILHNLADLPLVDLLAIAGRLPGNSS